MYCMLKYFLDCIGFIWLQRGESKSNLNIFGLEILNMSPLQTVLTPVYSDKFGLEWIGLDFSQPTYKLHS